MSDYYEDEWHDDAIEFDGGYDWIDDCYLLDDGSCLAAGSEDCDWHCPMNRYMGIPAARRILISDSVFLHRAANGQLFITEVMGYIGEDTEAGCEFEEKRMSLGMFVLEAKSMLIEWGCSIPVGDSINITDRLGELVSSVDDIPF